MSDRWSELEAAAQDAPARAEKAEAERDALAASIAADDDMPAKTWKAMWNGLRWKVDELRADLARVTAERDARPAITREDARTPLIVASQSIMKPAHEACERMTRALRAHAADKPTVGIDLASEPDRTVATIERGANVPAEVRRAVVVLMSTQEGCSHCYTPVALRTLRDWLAAPDEATPTMPADLVRRAKAWMAWLDDRRDDTKPPEDSEDLIRALAAMPEAGGDSAPTDATRSPIERCEICDWPIAASAEKGCVPGNCSYRPETGSPEHRRIQDRRAELARKRAEQDAAIVRTFDDGIEAAAKVASEIGASLTMWHDDQSPDDFVHRASVVVAIRRLTGMRREAMKGGGR